MRSYLEVARQLLTCLLAAVLACTGTVIRAAEPTETNFAPLGENFVLLGNRMQNNGWAGRDERAIRGHFSFKYTMLGTPYVPARSRVSDPKADKNKGWEFFLAYTGEFDFYYGTRASGPVINRLNNPAVYGRLPLQRYFGLGDKDDNVYLSLEHRSNGQVTDVASPLGRERAIRAYDIQDRHFFDAISRGSDFIAGTLELVDVAKEQVRDLDLRLKVRRFFHQENSVTWGPEAARGPSLNDYDRVTASVSWRNQLGWFDLTWRLGDGRGRTDSWTLGYQVSQQNFPLYVRLHRGPMNTLSNYTQRQDSLGFGFRFARP